VDYGSRDGEIQGILRCVVTKYSCDNYEDSRKMFFGRFVHTLELATYTKISMALGGTNHGEKRTTIYFGIGGSDMCHNNKKKMGG
jgi:hypothetical protein